jgi:hypothetical protein
MATDPRRVKELLVAALDLSMKQSFLLWLTVWKGMAIHATLRSGRFNVQ